MGEASEKKRRGGKAVERVDAVVVGGGPAGHVAAILLARQGLNVCLFAPPTPPGDTRTSALLRGSVHLLEAIGVWPAIARKAAPLAAMRLIDDTGRLMRAPTVTFRAEELGGGPFGHNIANRDLLAALAACAAGLNTLSVVSGEAARVTVAESHVEVRGKDGSIVRAALAVGADGRNSPCRKAAGIGVSERRFPQTALACNLTHSADHGNISTEIHKVEGPLTFVPMPGRASSLVWVTDPAGARRLMALDDSAFAEALRLQSRALLGDILSVGPRAAFPSASIVADTMAVRRVALVGEAGHVLPPIGAQGLNLGLRDAAMLAEVVAGHADGDIGGQACLAEYARRRRADVSTRAAAVDLLNRSVLGGFLPLSAARGAGLYMLDRFGPLRRAVMDLGLEPPSDVPRLMRGDA